MDHLLPAAPVAKGVVQPGSAFPIANTLAGMVGQYDPTNPGVPISYQNLSARPNPNAGSASTLGGDVLDTGTTFIHGTDNNENFYAELDAPLLKSLEADVAGRFDNYGGVGSDTTPKIGLKWQPCVARSPTCPTTAAAVRSPAFRSAIRT
jgi:hypothetical protein